MSADVCILPGRGLVVFRWGHFLFYVAPGRGRGGVVFAVPLEDGVHWWREWTTLN